MEDLHGGSYETTELLKLGSRCFRVDKCLYMGWELVHARHFGPTPDRPALHVDC